MPPKGVRRAGLAVLCNFNVVFLQFFYKSDLQLVTANDKYKNSQEEFFIFFPWSTPRGFITNLVVKIELLLNYRTDIRSCGSVG